MAPHTFTGWISYAAVMTSSAVTGFITVKMTLDIRKRRLGDRQDIVTVATFATLTMLAALLFWYAEAR
jgi:hypothetical protein